MPRNSLIAPSGNCRCCCDQPLEHCLAKRCFEFEADELLAMPHYPAALALRPGRLSHTQLSAATTVEHAMRQPWVDMSITRAGRLAAAVAHRRIEVQRGSRRAPAFRLGLVRLAMTIFSGRDFAPPV